MPVNSSVLRQEAQTSAALPPLPRPYSQASRHLCRALTRTWSWCRSRLRRGAGRQTGLGQGLCSHPCHPSPLLDNGLAHGKDSAQTTGWVSSMNATGEQMTRGAGRGRTGRDVRIARGLVRAGRLLQGRGGGDVGLTCTRRGAGRSTRQRWIFMRGEWRGTSMACRAGVQAASTNRGDCCTVVSRGARRATGCTAPRSSGGTLRNMPPHCCTARYVLFSRPLAIPPARRWPELPAVSRRSAYVQQCSCQRSPGGGTPRCCQKRSRNIVRNVHLATITLQARAVRALRAAARCKVRRRGRFAPAEELLPVERLEELLGLPDGCEHCSAHAISPS